MLAKVPYRNVAGRDISRDRRHIDSHSDWVGIHALGGKRVVANGAQSDLSNNTEGAGATEWLDFHNAGGGVKGTEDLGGITILDLNVILGVISKFSRVWHLPRQWDTSHARNRWCARCDGRNVARVETVGHRKAFVLLLCEGVFHSDINGIDRPACGNLRIGHQH